MCFCIHFKRRFLLFKDEDKEEMKEILEMKRRHDRYVNKRKEKLLAQQSTNPNKNIKL